MHRFITLSIFAAFFVAGAMSAVADNESAETPPPVVTGKTYRIAAGGSGTATAKDERPSACFGLRNIDGTDFVDVDAVAADKPSQIRTFTATADNPGVYAIANGAGQYINPVAGIYSPAKAGTVYQDARFSGKKVIYN